jgi:hypothetical protein
MKSMPMLPPQFGMQGTQLPSMNLFASNAKVPAIPQKEKKIEMPTF